MRRRGVSRKRDVGVLLTFDFFARREDLCGELDEFLGVGLFGGLDCGDGGAAVVSEGVAVRFLHLLD